MKNNVIEFIKYGFCGGITTIINLILFYVFTQVGLYYLFGNAISYYIAVLINFILNYIFVFERKTESFVSTIKKLVHFIILRTGSLGIDTILFFIMVTIAGFNIYGSRIVLSVAIIVINYIYSKNKIFKSETLKKE